MQDPEQKLIEPHETLLLESPEQRLRDEIAALKKELEEAKQKGKKKDDEKPEHPKPRTLWLIALGVVVVLLLAFFLGYLPHHRRESELKKEAEQEQKELPQVDCVKTQRSAKTHELLLPGTIEAYTDAPILARASGYIKKRYVDIGDYVKEGQLLAELDAPDLDQQVRQGRAQLSQAQAAKKQADASLEQAKANEELARVTAVRWSNLVSRGAVSRQENDTYQANYQAQIQNVGSLVEAVNAAKENVGAAQANLDRLIDLQSYEKVRAPFNGVVTVRNVDVGALINTANTLLFRVAQIDRLRTYIYVPQNDVAGVQVGQTADLFSPELGSRTFSGRVTRQANSLDPSTRTLLVEVQVPNPAHTLLPGMFVQVNLKNDRAYPPILIPGEALLVRSNGTFVGLLTSYRKLDPAEVKKEQESKEKAEGQDKKKTNKDKKTSGKGGGNDDKKKSTRNSGGPEQSQSSEVFEGSIHLQQVTVGRDYGNALEVLTGLSEGQLIVSNPNDSVNEGSRVHASLAKAQLDQIIASPNGAKNNANTERLESKPGAEPEPKQPSQANKTRGPSQ